MKQICPYSYYNENIFGLEDLYLYRAIFKVYSGDFTSALKDFDSSILIKKQQKSENENSDSDSD